MKRTLEALRKLRAQRRDRAVQTLGERTAETRTRREGLDLVQAQRAGVAGALASQREQEHLRGKTESMRAIDLQRLGAYEVAVRAELATLSHREAAAARALADARTEEGRARAGVQKKAAETRAVELRQQRLEGERRERSERTADEEAAELHLSRQRRG